MTNSDETETAPAPRHIRSEYQPDRTPPLVERWERFANTAPTDSGAQTQLIYHLLLQVRVVKLLLFWAAFGIAAIVVITMLILANTIDVSTPSYLP